MMRSRLNFLQKTYPYCAAFYRTLLAFIAGYIFMAYLAYDLAHLLSFYFPKAESIYLAAITAILLYLVFVISSFCINCLWKLTLLSLISCGFFYFISLYTG